MDELMYHVVLLGNGRNVCKTAGCAHFVGCDELKGHVAQHGTDLVVVFLDVEGAAVLIHDIRDGKVEGVDSTVKIVAVRDDATTDVADEVALLATVVEEKHLATELPRQHVAYGKVTYSRNEDEELNFLDRKTP